MGFRNIFLGVLTYFIFYLSLVKSIGTLLPIVKQKSDGTQAAFRYQDVFMHDPFELRFTITINDKGPNDDKWVSLCFETHDDHITYNHHQNICPDKSRILITDKTCSGNGGEIGCFPLAGMTKRSYIVAIKHKEDKWSAHINDIELQLYKISKYGPNKKPSIRMTFFVLVNSISRDCQEGVSEDCELDKDQMTIENGQIFNPNGVVTPLSLNPRTYSPRKTETTTEAQEENKEDKNSSNASASARFPYEIFIIVGVFLVFLIIVILGIKLFTEKWVWEFCQCCNRKGSDENSIKQHPVIDSDEKKHLVSGNMKDPDSIPATNQHQSETPGIGAPESSDGKVNLTPESKENPRIAQLPFLHSQPAPSSATTLPPPPPKAQKKKTKKSGGNLSSSVDSGTTLTTTGDTKTAKKLPKAPNLIVVTKADELEGPDAKTKNKVQKNYNEVRQQTAVSQDLKEMTIQTEQKKTKADTQSTKVGTMTKTRGISATQPRDKKGEALTGQAPTVKPKSISNTQGTKVTDGGNETRPTKIEYKERRGQDRIQQAHARMMTPAKQGLISGGTGGTQRTQNQTASTEQMATRATGVTQILSSHEKSNTHLPMGDNGRTSITQAQTRTTQEAGATRGGTKTTQTKVPTRTQDTESGIRGDTQGTQNPTMASATTKKQTPGTCTTQMPSNKTGETQAPTKTQEGKAGTTQAETRTTVSVGASGTQADTGGLTGTTQDVTKTTQGGDGTPITKKLIRQTDK